MDALSPELPSREVHDQRAIIDRRPLAAALTEVAKRSELAAERRRGLVLDALRQALAKGRAEIARRFEEREAGGAASVRSMSFLVDQVVRLIHDYADQHVFPVANPTMAERLAIVAVGGYGRQELAPQSDVDLLFLRPYKQTARGEQIVEFILYMLWDLGLKVGHSTRSLDECIRLAQDDITIRTALLESRYLWGDDKLAAELRKRFLAEIVKGTARAFIEAKLAERDQRHKRLGDSRYVLEPNVKEGKGGLRDLHTLFWIAKYVHRVDDVSELVLKGVLTAEEAAKFAKAQEFLSTVRCHLHYVAGRPEERLTFDVQSEIARRMGYTDHRGTRGVERFMKHYFLVAKDVGDLTRIFCAALEIDAEKKPKLNFGRLSLPAFMRRAKSPAGFAIESGRLTVAKTTSFADDPVNFLRIFRVAQENGLEVHPYALRLIRQNLRLVDARLRADAEANHIFMDILTDSNDAENTLRRMNEAGVFGRFVPDFGRVVAQMQHDMYHVYTVDEHTIFAIGILHRIESGALKADHPLSCEAIHKIQSRRALYLALLLHDIAKGRGGDHSLIGADIALKLGPRVGLSAEETETVSWLVRYHLAMSSTAFKRDIHDPKTIRDFAQLVQSPERLRLLLCLTVADIRAVGPNVWNNWKATLLRELYWRTEEVLAGAPADDSAKARVAAAQAALAAELKDWPAKEIEAHLARGYAAYWLACDAATLARHARLVREAERGQAPLAVDTRIDRARAITEITIYTSDHPGLFSRIAGAMALAGANIAGAQIFTMTNGMALDTFLIQDAAAGEVSGAPGAGVAFDRPERLARLSTHIEQALSGRLRLKEALARRPAIPSRTAVFTVPPRVLIDNAASATHTLIEVNGRDRTGLLFDVTSALTELGLSISTAKIATYGERVVDVFYVKDVFGHKIDQEHKLKRIRERLLAALADPDAEAGKPSAAPLRPRRRASAAAAQ
ncbi:MAG TPA: [protein-PII] uridylyltransferase [Alphaproteobacteria bacterium]|nr:[protein-PII] uridylyltransferase [Alphaproteobacteria bacterium]